MQLSSARKLILDLILSVCTQLILRLGNEAVPQKTPIIVDRASLEKFNKIINKIKIDIYFV